MRSRLLTLIGAIFIVPFATLWLTESSAESSEEVLTLELLQQAALEYNPTLAQAEADVEATEGRRIQARLYPNPRVGYESEEISVENPDDNGIHSIFIEQEIITAGKLRYREDIFRQERLQAESEYEAQKARVLNDVRIAFYRVLGAQQIVELREGLSRIANEAVDTSSQLFNIGQADRADVLESEVEAQRAELELAEAQNQLESEWTMLAGAVGQPRLPKAPLKGELRDEIGRLDYDAVELSLLRDNPLIKAAQSGVNQAEASLQYERAARFPNVTVRGGIGYNTELDESQALLGLTLPLPVFDRNQGSILSARSQLEHARQEARRLELILSSRLASVFAQYSSSLEAIDRYENQILPKAETAYNLYLERFKEMAASYPQVIISQRNYFRAKADYIDALVRYQETRAKIEGFLLTGGLEGPLTRNEFQGKSEHAGR